MLKKNLFGFVLILLLVFMTACGNSANTGSNDGGEGGVSGIVPIYTPGTGGMQYILSAGISNIFNQTKVMEKVNLTTEATSGSPEILQQLIDRYESNKPAFGGLASSSVTEIYNGDYSKISGEHKELRGVAFLNDTSLHVITAADSSINTFADLKGKKLGAPPGSAPTVLLQKLLETSYGLTENDYTLVPIGFSEVQQGIQNGSIDAGLLMGAIPSPLVKEAQSLTDIRMLSIDENEWNTFHEEYPQYASTKVKAGTYDGQDKDLLLLTMIGILITHEKTDETLVYNVVKTMIENPDELKDIHPTVNINKDTIQNGIQIPLHPGAEKYYKEIGILE